MPGKSKRRVGAAILLLALAGLPSAASAYVTLRTKRLVNEFSPGKVLVTLLEENWEGEQEVLPGQRVKKDPAGKNGGDFPIWLYCRIELPVVQTARFEEHRAVGKREGALFDYEISPSWSLLDRRDGRTRSVRWYGYEKQLEAGETSDPLFEEVEMVNYLEGEIGPGKDLPIGVRMQALQALPAGPSMQALFESLIKPEEGE